MWVGVLCPGLFLTHFCESQLDVLPHGRHLCRDHAGGNSKVVRAFPEVEVYVHAMLFSAALDLLLLMR